jgi:hypothetical protein
MGGGVQFHVNTAPFLSIMAFGEHRGPGTTPWGHQGWLHSRRWNLAEECRLPWGKLFQALNFTYKKTETQGEEGTKWPELGLWLRQLVSAQPGSQAPALHGTQYSHGDQPSVLVCKPETQVLHFLFQDKQALDFFNLSL